jgi:hypothetical protein
MPDGRSRQMTRGDLDHIVRKIPRSQDGSIRLMASLAVEGELIGPFRYSGTRTDDPNDLVAHQNRRDLRGLFVFAAWLNHTDSKAANTLDTVIQENDIRFIRHYLIDFGSALGSDGDRPKNARIGNEFILPNPWSVLKRIFMFGLFPSSWERATGSDLPPAGHLESISFQPDQWKTNYPNPAFLNRLPDDEFWAAKQIMAFSDSDIRAIVETGRFSDARVVDYLTKTLAQRRDVIGRTYFSKLAPLDGFLIRDGELHFENLAVKYGFPSEDEYKVRWFAFDNIKEQQHRLQSSNSLSLPVEALDSTPGNYFLAVIDPVNEELKTVRVYLRTTTHGFEVVGIERTWKK